MSYKSETNWMDELDSKLKNLVDLESARAQEAWEKHVVRMLTYINSCKSLILKIG